MTHSNGSAFLSAGAARRRRGRRLVARGLGGGAVLAADAASFGVGAGGVALSRLGLGRRRRGGGRSPATATGWRIGGGGQPRRDRSGAAGLRRGRSPSGGAAGTAALGRAAGDGAGGCRGGSGAAAAAGRPGWRRRRRHRRGRRQRRRAIVRGGRALRARQHPGAVAGDRHQHDEPAVDPEAITLAAGRVDASTCEDGEVGEDGNVWAA